MHCYIIHTLEFGMYCRFMYSMFAADDSKEQWVYLLKLHVQDATAELDLALFDQDADQFFQVIQHRVLPHSWRMVTVH